MNEQVNLNEMSVTELKALLFDIDMNIKGHQRDYQHVAAIFEKKVQDQKKAQEQIIEKPIEEKKEEKIEKPKK